MNEFNDIKDEKELLLKLFKTDHLNVPERKNLPKGEVRESAARELIKNLLKAHGWFPCEKQKPIGDAGGSYLQLELKVDGSANLHENYEYSYLKYKHHCTEFESIDESITAYLKRKEKEGLDGLKIDWKS